MTKVDQAVEAKKAEKLTQAGGAGSPRQVIAALLATRPLDAELAKQINDVKRKAKRGYHKLGVSYGTEVKIKALL